MLVGKKMAIFDNKKVKKLTINIILVQFATAIIVASGFGVLKSFTAFYSSLIGGAMVVLPSCLFAVLTFTLMGRDRAHSFVYSIYLGESVKILTTIMLLYIVMRYLPVDELTVLITFIITLVSYWLVPILNFSTVNVTQKRT